MTTSDIRPGRIVVAVVGALLALVAFGTGVAGGVLTWAHTTQRDDAGYYTTSSEQLQTDAHALVSERVDFGTRVGDHNWTPFDDQRGDFKITTRPAGDQPIFIGIARPAAVEEYLSGVSYDVVTAEGGPIFEPEYTRVAGDDPATPPGETEIWLASITGSGEQTLVWDGEAGPWVAVVMNANGGPGISIDASIGARTGLLLPIGLGLLAFAVMTALIGVALVIASAVPETGTLYHHPIPAPAVAGAHPVRLDGHLDFELSRWKWLVKWFLAIPHLIILCLLWPVAIVVTLLAAVAIVVTGTYPRALFDLNVGIMRWSWRVTFYAFALGTDRYPPFSLAPDPSYPADLTIQYPTALSRGLVFVKWLLALPHYLVVALFGGLGGVAWEWGDDRFTGFGAGVVGLLVFVAAIILLFSGRYPQQLFDVIMGMQRWSYRVYGYVGMMTDEYPPFRFDGGGADPGSVPISPPPLPAPSDRLVGSP